MASVGGIQLEKAIPDGGKGIDKEAIEEETKKKASDIIQNKGATNYGIGGVAASICTSVLFDEKIIRPVSCWQEGLGVCLSVPVVLGRKGVVRAVELELSAEERGKLEKSAKALKEVIEA